MEGFVRSAALPLGEISSLLNRPAAIHRPYAITLPLDALCRVVPICGLRGALREARFAFLAVLDRYSLAGRVHRKAGLCALSHAA